MIKKANVLNKRYLITPSLLNSWGNIWDCVRYVKESDNDEISFEDKTSIAQDKAKLEFIDRLKKVEIPPNKYMLDGIQFEEECYNGNTCISPIIKDGCYQIVGMKDVTVSGINFLMYGRLDVLKGGIIYDIKKVTHYEPQKYKSSYQHKFYMDLFPTAKKFVYLAFDGNKLHTETYYADECKATTDSIKDFINWLKENDLLETYFEFWESKDNKE